MAWIKSDKMKLLLDDLLLTFSYAAIRGHSAAAAKMRQHYTEFI